MCLPLFAYIVFYLLNIITTRLLTFGMGCPLTLIRDTVHHNTCGSF